MVILHLLLNEVIAQDDTPGVKNLRHAVPLLKPPPSVREKSVNEIEAIVLHLFITCIFYAPPMKLALQVITDVRPECIPQLSGPGRSALTQDGDK
jgi:hypothetical protein